MSTAKLGSFDDLLAITSESLRPVMMRLRDIILEIKPDTSDVVRLGDRAATYGLGPRKMIEGFVYLMPFKGWVNLGFYRGVDLPDPEGKLEGTGKKLRHIKIRSVEECEQPWIRELVKAAVDERIEALSK
jgi:hypothetical protein